MRSLIALALMTLPAMADELPLPVSCAGSGPDWSLSVGQDGTVFQYVFETELEIALRTQAEGAEWPLALTLIGRGDSAILLLEEPEGGTSPARILTQRGETPVLLVGRCQLASR